MRGCMGGWVGACVRSCLLARVHACVRVGARVCVAYTLIVDASDISYNVLRRITHDSDCRPPISSHHKKYEITVTTGIVNTTEHAIISLQVLHPLDVGGSCANNKHNQRCRQNIAITRVPVEPKSLFFGWHQLEKPENHNTAD